MTDEPARAAIHPAIMAMATWKELNATQSTYAAAVLRKDTEAANRIRREAHDLLDACLDLNGEIVGHQMAPFER